MSPPCRGRLARHDDGFSVKPEQNFGIKVGNKIDFEIDWDGKAGTVTKIAKSGS